MLRTISTYCSILNPSGYLAAAPNRLSYYSNETYFQMYAYDIHFTFPSGVQPYMATDVIRGIIGVQLC